MNWVPVKAEIPEAGEIVLFWDKEDKAVKAGCYLPHECKGGACRPAKWIAGGGYDQNDVIVPTGDVTHWVMLEDIPGPGMENE